MNTGQKLQRLKEQKRDVAFDCLYNIILVLLKSRIKNENFYKIMSFNEKNSFTGRDIEQNTPVFEYMNHTTEYENDLFIEDVSDELEKNENLTIKRHNLIYINCGAGSMIELELDSV